MAQPRARSLRGGLAVHVRAPAAGGAHASGLRMAAAHWAADARSPGRRAQLARSHGDAQGAARPRLRADGALAGHRVVHARARAPGAAASCAHPPVTAPIPLIQADIFTTQAFAGNPAAAVLDADRLDEAAMQRSAGATLVAGTAFLSAPGDSDAAWRLPSSRLT